MISCLCINPSKRVTKLPTHHHTSFICCYCFSYKTRWTGFNRHD